MTTSNIEWTEQVWNPITGCSKVSAGCKNCYADTLFTNRLSQNPKLTKYFGRKFTDVQCHPELLDVPLRRKKPTTYFVNSMSDLFHEAVPDEFIAHVFAVMHLAHWHRYIILTKRHHRMLDLVTRISADPEAYCYAWARESDSWLDNAPKMDFSAPEIWPLPNVILGVSVEDQATADERIPLLLKTPAAIRMVSYEPALGPVDFKRSLREVWSPPSLDLETGKETPAQKHSSRIDWIIVGGESGHGARPCNVEWIRSTVNQCRAASVKCFVKQLGHKPHSGDPATSGHYILKDKKGGDPSEWPSDLRVRETP
jgi:protein gp37